jgi:hypothetical protein
MLKQVFLSLFCLTAPLLWASDKFQPLNVKTGLWQITSTTKTAGAPPISADMQARLAQMPPEQRARIEAYLKSMTSGVPKNRTYKSCLTKAQLNGNPFADKDCKWDEMTSTGTKLAARGTCVSGSDNIKTNIVMHIVVLDSEHAKGTGTVAFSNGERSMTSDYVMNAKYLGSNCRDTE